MEQDTARKAKQIGEVIRAGRHALSLSQEDFAERCDLHRTYVGALERGEENLSLQTLLKICAALRLRPSELLIRAEL